jgi:uncharacterized protein (DUF488 family)
MKVFTIGFKGRSAEDFFVTLRNAGVEKLIDVRRRNSSQLSGYSKGEDLKFFLEKCFAISYEHIPEFAPSERLLSEYQKRSGKKKRNDNAWAYYVEEFGKEVLRDKTVHRFQEAVDSLDAVCLLCSEETAERCHRRLLAEFLKEHLPGIELEHL